MNWRKFWEKNVVSIAIIVCKAHIIKNGMVWMIYVRSLLIAYSSQICEYLSYQCHRRAISRRKNIKIKRKTSYYI